MISNYWQPKDYLGDINLATLDTKFHSDLVKLLIKAVDKQQGKNITCNNLLYSLDNLEPQLTKDFIKKHKNNLLNLYEYSDVFYLFFGSGLDLNYIYLETFYYCGNCIMGEYKLDHWTTYEDGESGFIDSKKYKAHIKKYLKSYLTIL